MRAQFASELSDEAELIDLPIALELDMRCRPKASKTMPCGRFAIDPYMRRLITRIVLRFSSQTKWSCQSLHSVARPFLAVLMPELFASMPQLDEAEVSLWWTWYTFTTAATLEQSPPMRCLELRRIKGV